MTVHLSVRSISAVLSLSATLLVLPAEAPAQSAVAPQGTAPALAERLDRLAAEFDRNRIDSHVPGAVLAPDTFTLGAASALRASVPRP